MRLIADGKKGWWGRGGGRDMNSSSSRLRLIRDGKRGESGGGE